MVPIQPSPYDIWAADEIIKLIAEASVFKEKLKSVFVINRRIVNTAIGRDVVAALEQYPIPMLKASISQRVAFAESAATGGTVLETDSTGPAAKEVMALVEELMTLGV